MDQWVMTWKNRAAFSETGWASRSVMARISPLVETPDWTVLVAPLRTAPVSFGVYMAAGVQSTWFGERRTVAVRLMARRERVKVNAKWGWPATVSRAVYATATCASAKDEKWKKLRVEWVLPDRKAAPTVLLESVTG